MGLRVVPAAQCDGLSNKLKPRDLYFLPTFSSSDSVVETISYHHVTDPVSYLLPWIVRRCSFYGVNIIIDISNPAYNDYGQ